MQILKLIAIIAVAIVLFFFVLTPHGPHGIQPPQPMPPGPPQMPSDLLASAQADSNDTTHVPTGWCNLYGQLTGKVAEGNTIDLLLIVRPIDNANITVLTIYGSIIPWTKGFFVEAPLLDIGPYTQGVPLPNDGKLYWSHDVPLRYEIQGQIQKGFKLPLEIRVEVACAQPGLDLIERADIKLIVPAT